MTFGSRDLVTRACWALEGAEDRREIGVAWIGLPSPVTNEKGEPEDEGDVDSVNGLSDDPGTPH